MYGDGNNMEPTIYADVSQTAVDDAVSFDGLHCMAGLSLILHEYGASVSGGNNYTPNDISTIAPTIGVGYTKTFNGNFLLGIDVLTSFSKKEKKCENWNTLNSDFDRLFPAANRKNGILTTDIFEPSLGLKFGYIFKEYKFAAFGKLIASKIGGKFAYYSDLKNCNFNVNAVIFGISVGGEMKFNKKFGASLEIGTFMKKQVKKTNENTEHIVKFGKTDVKVLLIYNL
jgi:hypothetical protein